MIAFLDMDGVLVDWFAGSMNHFALSWDKFKSADRPVHHHWILHQANLTIDQYYERCDETFWANLDWSIDGREILKAVESTFYPNNVCILTSPGPSHHAAHGKILWIKKHMPQYMDRFLIGSPKELCASTNKVLIDDSDKKVINFRIHGGEAILIPRPWNKNHSLDTLTYLKESLNFYEV